MKRQVRGILLLCCIGLAAQSLVGCSSKPNGGKISVKDFKGGPMPPEAVKAMQEGMAKARAQAAAQAQAKAAQPQTSH